MASFNGAVEVLFQGEVGGWACDMNRPEERLTVIIRSGGSDLLAVEASRLRSDLADAGIGDGRYGFEAAIASDIDPASVSVAISGSDFELPVRPEAYAPAWLNPEGLPDTQINVFNLEQLQTQPPARHFYMRLDTNFDCNLHCVYCHNPRTKELVDIAVLSKYLQHGVLGVENFQIGCAMEPTLDPRLTDFMLMIADTPARPRNIFQLQTNGTLLHRHDYAHMKAAGLTSLSVSLDSAEPETQKLLRSGTSLTKVLRNVSAFRDACPEIDVQFITTVTTANVDRLGEIVRLGLDLGVNNFAFREIFYNLENTIVDHTRMPALLLKEGAFAAVQKRLLADFPDVLLEFFSTDALSDAERKIKADSLL